MKTTMIKALVILIVLTASAYTRMPYWIHDPYDEYSSDVYFTSVGNGLSRDDAINKAFASISRVFGISVDSKTRSFEQYIDTHNSSEYSSYLDDNTQIASKHNLVNVDIKKSYYDTKTSTHYALAVMHKKDTANIIEGMIRKNNIAVDKYLDLAQKEEDHLRKYSLVVMAIVIAEKSEVLSYQLPYLDSENSIEYKSSGSIRQIANDIAYNITFYVEPKYDIASPLQHSIESVISDMNMKIVSKENNPIYTIKEKLVYTENDHTQYGGYLLTYNFALSLVDSKGRAVTSFAFTGTTIGENKQLALKNLKSEVARNVSKELEEKFLSYLNSIISNN